MFDAKRKKGNFVGYAHETKRFEVYFPDSKLIKVSHNVVFIVSIGSIDIAMDESESPID